MSIRSRSTRSAASGQALVETCLVMIVACLLLFGLFQVSQLYASKEILDYAAVAGARARAVGFNDFMVHKVVRAAAIPNAGRMIEPDVDRDPAAALRWGASRPGELWDFALRDHPDSPQYEVESSRIPLYLGAENWGWLSGILDYEDWSTIWHTLLEWPGANLVTSRTGQTIPLRDRALFTFHRTFYAADTVSLRPGQVTMDDHYPLYLDDGN